MTAEIAIAPEQLPLGRWIDRPHGRVNHLVMKGLTGHIALITIPESIALNLRLPRHQEQAG